MNFILHHKLHHLILWVIYFTFWTTFSAINYHTPVVYALLVTGIFFIGQAGAGYFLIYVAVPRLLGRKRYIAFALVTIGCIMVSSLFIAFGNNAVFPLYQPNYRLTFKYFLQGIFISNVYGILLLLALKTIKDKLVNDRRNKLLDKERAENELRFLKSQINPHFVFNVINSIYVLIKKDPAFAADTLARFADMLRYQLYECNVDAVAIEKEIAYLNNYIEMERLRKGNTLIVDYSIDEQVKNFFIAPVLIIPFVENAFKYVSSFTDRINLVAIHLSCKDNTFTLRVENTIDEKAEIGKEKSFGGIGLGNVKRRLELIYNNHQQLKISCNDSLYSVLLKIQIA